MDVKKTAEKGMDQPAIVSNFAVHAIRESGHVYIEKTEPAMK